VNPIGGTDATSAPCSSSHSLRSQQVSQRAVAADSLPTNARNETSGVAVAHEIACIPDAVNYASGGALFLATVAEKADDVLTRSARRSLQASRPRLP
jgi:hypothetical protein